MQEKYQFRRTVCPKCNFSFKFGYQAGQLMYTMLCINPACREQLLVDISKHLQPKVTVYRGNGVVSTENEALELQLPEELLASLQKPDQ